MEFISKKEFITIILFHIKCTQRYSRYPIALFSQSLDGPSLYEIKGKHVVLLGLSLSLFIELSQLFLPRWTDIDDIILNTFGTFIGYPLYKYCVKIYNRE